jgi:hypothetical protein
MLTKPGLNFLHDSGLSSKRSVIKPWWNEKIKAAKQDAEIQILRNTCKEISLVLGALNVTSLIVT